MIERPLILLGAPGSGKGTLASILTRIWPVPVIATGTLLREESLGGGALAMKLREVMNSGRLVDEELVNDVVAKRISDEECGGGCILDGYPRSVSQARYLDTLIHRHGYPEPAVIELVASEAIVCGRLEGRLQCVACGTIYNKQDRRPAHPGTCDHDGMPLVRRPDDRHETVLARMRIYEEMIAPLSRYCQAHWAYCRISGDQSPADVLDRVQDFLMQLTYPIYNSQVSQSGFGNQKGQ